MPITVSFRAKVLHFINSKKNYAITADDRQQAINFLEVYEKENIDEMGAIDLYNFANCYKFAAPPFKINLGDSIIYLAVATRIYMKIPDRTNDISNELAQVYLSLAIAHHENKDYRASSSYFIEVLKIYNQLNDVNNLLASTQIMTSYLEKQSQPKAENFFSLRR